MDERRCGVISMVEASDCRGGVAVSMCSLEAVARERITIKHIMAGLQCHLTRNSELLTVMHLYRFNITQMVLSV